MNTRKKKIVLYLALIAVTIFLSEYIMEALLYLILPKHGSITSLSVDETFLLKLKFTFILWLYTSLAFAFVTYIKKYTAITRLLIILTPMLVSSSLVLIGKVNQINEAIKFSERINNVKYIYLVDSLSLYTIPLAGLIFSFIVAYIVSSYK